MSALAALCCALAAGAFAAPAAVPASTQAFALPLLAAPTVPLTVPLVIERFEALDAGLKSLSADFKQALRWDESGTSQSVEGTLEFRKPGLMRLQHRTPEPQTLVADGTWLWIYRESTHQVIKTRFEEWRKSEPLAQGLLGFGHYADMLKSYDVSISSDAAEPDGHRRFSLLLKPRKGDGGKGDFTLTLRMTTRDFFPAQTELRADNVTIKSSFSNIRYNPTLPDERFRFAPPRGADVFENFKPLKGP